MSLLRVMPEDARMLLVRGPYQLPPIGMGLVFAALAEPITDRNQSVTDCHRLVPRVELTVAHRQVASMGISAIVHQIRHGTVPGLRSPL